MKLLRPIVFLDLETTGKVIAEDRIVELACIKLYPDGREEEKSYLINPGMSIPADASAIHGITDEKVKDAPYFKQFANTLNEWLRDCDLGGYNSNRFDFPMLIEEFHRCKISFPSWELSLVDAYINEIRIRPQTLGAVYERYFGESLEGAHNALPDVRATIRILREQIKAEPEITPAEIDAVCQGEKKRYDYAGKFYERDGVVYFSFGKNKDKAINLDKSYIRFFMEADFPKESKDKLQLYLIDNPPPETLNAYKIRSKCMLACKCIEPTECPQYSKPK